MKGRKPVPVELKLIRGNPGRRPIHSDVPRPKVKAPTCPKHLDGEARKEWARLCKVAGNVITELDRSVLAMICSTWARYVEAEQAIEKMAAASGGSGMFVKTAQGKIATSPWVHASNRHIELHTRLCLEFGLTPCSRTRIRTGAVAPVPPLKNTEEGWSQFKS